MYYALCPVCVSVADNLFFLVEGINGVKMLVMWTLEEPEAVIRHFLSLWGPVQVDLLRVKDLVTDKHGRICLFRAEHLYSAVDGIVTLLMDCAMKEGETYTTCVTC